MTSYRITLKQQALRDSDIFWDIPKEKIPQLSEEAIVERVLNYGNMEQFKAIVKNKGEFSKIYSKIRNKERCNLSPLVINYIDLYLKNNA